MTSCPGTQKDGRSDSASNPKPKYSFVVEWYDPVAQVIKKFLMSYYAVDGTVELYDLKNHRVFLRRCKPEGVKLDNLYKSATVTIMARQLRVIDYADNFTKHKFERELTHTFCMVKPDIFSRIGEIISIIYKEGFKIINMKTGQMSSDCAAEFYKEHEGKPYLPDLLRFMASGPIVAMIIIGENAIERWQNLIGPRDAEEARRVAPHTLRAMFGTDVTRNGLHGSRDEEHATWEMDMFFPKVVPKDKRDFIKQTCACKNTSCCIVKPHAVVDGHLGDIITYINEKGFKITAIEMFTLDVGTAEEFLEVYKGVVPEYSAMVIQLTSGPCVVLEVMDVTNPECTQETFRKAAGPTDPEIARKLRPGTIRAKFGKTKVLNAVHCTDLPDDATLEVEYFFKILQT